jgi:hypothetical protein
VRAVCWYPQSRQGAARALHLDCSRTYIEKIEVWLFAVGAGPTLDRADAVAFLAGFEPLIEKAQAAAAMRG